MDLTGTEQRKNIKKIIINRFLKVFSSNKLFFEVFFVRSAVPEGSRRGRASVRPGRIAKEMLRTKKKNPRGNTIFKVENRKCIGCDKFINKTEIKFPIIENSNERIFSEETAYQITAILSGAVERGTAKKLKSLKKCCTIVKNQGFEACSMVPKSAKKSIKNQSTM